MGQRAWWQFWMAMVSKVPSVQQVRNFRWNFLSGKRVSEFARAQLAKNLYASKVCEKHDGMIPNVSKCRVSKSLVLSFKIFCWCSVLETIPRPFQYFCHVTYLLHVTCLVFLMSFWVGQELYTKPAMAMESAYAETQRGIERSHAIDAQRSGTTAWVSAFYRRNKAISMWPQFGKQSLWRSFFGEIVWVFFFLASTVLCMHAVRSYVCISTLEISWNHISKKSIHHMSHKIHFCVERVYMSLDSTLFFCFLARR